MNQSHKAFFEQPEGQKLASIIRQPELLRVYEVLSHAQMPPVQAIVPEVDPLLAKMEPEKRGRAAQSCGALIGEILAERGYRVMRGSKGEKRRGKTRRSDFIKTGALFEKVEPNPDPNFDKAMKIAREMMVKYRKTFEALAK